MTLLPAGTELEEGEAFTPRFDRDGLIVCVTRDAADGQILMLAYMNDEALAKTRETSPRPAVSISPPKSSTTRNGGP